MSTHHAISHTRQFRLDIRQLWSEIVVTWLILLALLFGPTLILLGVMYLVQEGMPMTLLIMTMSAGLLVAYRSAGK